MILDKCRDIAEFKELYNKRQMPNSYEFFWLINNPNLYCFYDEKDNFLRGYITLQEEDGELTLSGASIRKNFKENIDAVKMVCKAVNKTIYAYTPLKHAGLVLKKAGFKRLYDNKYVYEV